MSHSLENFGLRSLAPFCAVLVTFRLAAEAGKKSRNGIYKYDQKYLAKRCGGPRKNIRSYCFHGKRVAGGYFIKKGALRITAAANGPLSSPFSMTMSFLRCPLLFNDSRPAFVIGGGHAAGSCHVTLYLTLDGIVSLGVSMHRAWFTPPAFRCAS